MERKSGQFHNLKFRPDTQAWFAGHPAEKNVALASRWIWLASMGVGALWLYFLLVISSGDSASGFHIRARYLPAIALVSFASIYWIIRWAYARPVIPLHSFKALALFTPAVLAAILFADVAYSLYLNATIPDYNQDVDKYRMTDQRLWVWEAMPRRYYPTRANFQIHKPNVTARFRMYGDLYHPSLLKSATVARSVLELRDVVYSIDENGFRETTPLSEARIFALGDSFTFGVSVTQESTWVNVLNRLTGASIYNLGVSGNSPGQQLMLLENILRTKANAVKVRHVLWMICEGNDLEDSYDTERPVEYEEKASGNDVFRGTIVETLSRIPSTLRRQSVIHRVITGQVAFSLPSRVPDRLDPYLVDGARLSVPVYYSSRYGYKLFYPPYIERVTKPESYITSHPNRPLLDNTFKQMALLGKKHGFTVTIVIAPTAERMYGAHFEKFPSIPSEPYFVNYLEKLSAALDFNVINLHPLLQSYVREELLYWRDDTHWNERGHRVVAEIIMNELKASRSKSKKTHSKK